jgi:hypothetical protein
MGNPLMNAPGASPVAARSVHAKDRPPLLASTGDPGSLTPAFVLPPGFEQRLGKRSDFFFSGIFPADGLRIGYIRIPAFAPIAGFGRPAPESAGIAQFAAEIAYLEANTDGLVVDIVQNPGGSPTYMDGLYNCLSPQPFQQLHVVWRPTLFLLEQTYVEFADAQANHADPVEAAFHERKFHIVEDSYRQGTELTLPFPILGTTDLREPARDPQGRLAAYTKPIVLLTNDQIPLDGLLRQRRCAAGRLRRSHDEGEPAEQWDDLQPPARPPRSRHTSTGRTRVGRNRPARW